MTDRNFQRMKEEISNRSGLSVAVVSSLLDAGYSYVEQINEPVKWVRDGNLRK